MKTIKIANKEYVFIEVPHDARNFRYDSWFTRYIVYDESGSITPDFYSKIITTTNNITEEVAGNVVEKWRMIQGEIGQGDANLFTNYLNLFSSSATAFTNTALESFYSLMDSLELDRSKNYLLIEKL